MGIIFRCVAVVGVIVCITSSSAINGYFGTTLGPGFSSGAPVFESLIYGLVFLSGDLVKSYLPIAAETSFRTKDRTNDLRSATASRFKGLLCLLAFGLLVCASLVAGVGLMATIRSEGAGGIEAAKADYQRLVADKERLSEELNALGPVRSPEAVQASIEAGKVHKIYDRTKGCKDATIPESRDWCAEFKLFAGELAKAKRAETLQSDLRTVSERLGNVDTKTAMQVANPQAQALGRLTGTQIEDVNLALSLLTAGVLELISSLGLWFLGVKIALSSPKLPKAKTKKTTAPVAISQPEDNSECPVKRWADSHLAVRSGSKVKTGDIIDSYRNWSYSKGEDRLHGNQLGRKLTALGYQRKKIGGTAYYVDVALVPSARLVAVA